MTPLQRRAIAIVHSWRNFQNHGIAYYVQEAFVALFRGEGDFEKDIFRQQCNLSSSDFPDDLHK